MKNASQVKLGIVVGSTDWLPEGLAVKKRSELIDSYNAQYCADDIHECSVCVNDNEVSVKRAMRDLAKAGCNALCIYYANYGPESAGTMLANEFDGPVMMIASAEEGSGPYEEERTDAMSGFINACYALNLRKTNVHIPAKPVGTVLECAEMIHEFIPIARTLISVRDLKVISFGPRPSSYLAAYAPSHMLYDVGVEVSEYSELELFDSFTKHEGDKRIEAVVEDMASELGVDADNAPASLRRFAQYELTVRDWVRGHKGNRKNIALTSTCWPAFPVTFGFVPCYVNSRLTNEGMPVACEVDVYGAISEYIGQCVSDDSVAILNINNNVPQVVFDEQIEGREFAGKEYKLDDLFIGYHCGTTCSSKLQSCSLKPHFVNNQLIGPEKSQGTIQGQIVPGAVTLFRMQGMRDGSLRAYVAQGQVLPVSMDTYGGFGVIAVPEFARFFRNVVIGKHFPNHVAVVFGHFGEALVDVLRQLGVEEIDYNHPESIPYAGENAFSALDDWF